MYKFIFFVFVLLEL